MSVVYRMQSEDRTTFVKTVFERLHIQREAAGKNILIKPNVVSHEPYPTTTHPEMVEACVELLRGTAKSIVVADGPAWDSGDTDAVIREHPLKQTCDGLRVPFVNLLRDGIRKTRTRTYELDIAQMALACDLILSLPVLKSHGMGLTGALKNQFGVLHPEEKIRSHRTRDMNVVVAEINEVVRPDLCIVDAVRTMIDTNEVRHGGRPHELGYLLAGTDPVSLDTEGLSLLKMVEPKLQDKQIEDIGHVNHAAGLGIGKTVYEIVEL